MLDHMIMYSYTYAQITAELLAKTEGWLVMFMLTMVRIPDWEGKIIVVQYWSDWDTKGKIL